ncbi:MAG TPA: hypothetical protein VHA37_03205, partial [Candidatus Saccharimonadales bacterium]|nr:hypothetical protein [Candidatus Saccharimonadales bacterium]
MLEPRPSRKAESKPTRYLPRLAGFFVRRRPAKAGAEFRHRVSHSQVGIFLPKQRRKLPPVHVGQADIEKHDVGTKIGHGFRGREGGIAYLGRMAGRRHPNRDLRRRIAVV